MKYLPRNPLEAFKYNGENVDELPQWARDYRGFNSAVGSAAIFRDAVRTLRIPAGDHYTPVFPGDWLVYNGDTIIVVKDAKFQNDYVAVEEPTEDAAS